MKVIWIAVFLFLCACIPVFIWRYGTMQKEMENKRHSLCEQGRKVESSSKQELPIKHIDTVFSVMPEGYGSADEMKLMVAICRHLYRENDSLRTVIAARSAMRVHY